MRDRGSEDASPKYVAGSDPVRALLLSLVAIGVAETPAASDMVVASATGSGHMVRPDGTLQSFSFSARRYADGTSSGELQLNSRSFDVVVHIKIDCLRVVGNVAHMTGRITRVSNPDEGEVGELIASRCETRGGRSRCT